MKPARTSSLFIAIPLLASACSPQVDIGSLKHGSGGGTQNTKTCNVQVLATGLHNPSSIAYANHMVFVATREADGTSSIVSIPVTGGTPTTLASGIPVIFGRGIAADATRVYSTSGETPSMPMGGPVSSVPVQGGTPTVLVPSGAWGSAIAIDLSYVYWGGAHGDVFRTPVAGGATTTLYSSGVDTPVESIAVDDGYVYWGASDSPQLGTGSTFKKLPLVGGTPMDVVQIDSYVGAIAPYGGYLYVENAGSSISVPMSGPPTGNGSIVRVPIDLSSPATSLASNLPYPSAIAVDASGVYWGGVIPQPNGDAPMAVNRIPADTTTVESIGSSAVSQMVQCMDGICWADEASGKVNRFVECDTPSMNPNPNPSPCDTFCTALGGCAPSDCVTTCHVLYESACGTQGAALATCIASHTDPVSCKASGCDQETQALSTCRGFPSNTCSQPGCMAIGGATTTCDCDSTCQSGHARAKCEIANGTAACTCYLNDTPIGTCQMPSQPTDPMGVEANCSLTSGCCSASF